MSTRPKVTLNPPADRHHAPGERTVEVSWPCGAGCLVLLRTRPNGQPILDVYRADDQISVLDGRATSTYVVETQWDGKGPWEPITSTETNDKDHALETYERLQANRLTGPHRTTAFRLVETSHRVLRTQKDPQT